MSKPFQKILHETQCAADGLGMAELSRLNESLRYWAPEMKEHCFWYGQGNVWGYLDILNNYFQDNTEVRRVYKKFMDDYYANSK